MNNDLLAKYEAIVGSDVIDQLKQMASRLKDARILHVNSTRYGGGVAEILRSMVPLMEALGLSVRWEVIAGDEPFFQVTKSFHNALQGFPVDFTPGSIETYENNNRKEFEKLEKFLKEADFVVIHDPQPAFLIKLMPERKNKWVWRCHIDLSKPYRPVWRYLKNIVKDYDASIFSMPDFTQPLPHPQYIIPPSIDPLTEKNMDLPEDEVKAVYDRFGLDPEKPLVLQVSRYDRFKDPVGVIQAAIMAMKFIPFQLVYAGGGAADDPEGEIIYQEVQALAKAHPDIHVLYLPPDAHRTINALQRAAHVVLQKSIKEGFGLTVTEAMWKYKPVIGGDTGGIRLQVVNHHTGFLVHTPEGTALRIRYLLFYQEKRNEMGKKAHQFVKENFLITRHVRDYLSLMLSFISGNGERIELEAI
ncbi:glycosyl transferase group 1 [Thermodesulfatator indicus DSM 15286]|uniref:Glycosyl transferase group 1 n=1 Tax=Thermodesulfatator indicus (strain DSM 15286 / JCM 11887 / CIR29812) TaxID=667014 RepID=F8ABG3_THEID|nr:glycosyltransferase [Thermodesulfatator indicus]AEH44475.1 glycosyl transferase group 1 [Thermodesulfatator indicus DSM 15286]